MKFVLRINLKLQAIAYSFFLNIAEHEYLSANKYENANHYENMPIQIYCKFYHQKKNENFQIKILIFFIFLLKT